MEAKTDAASRALELLKNMNASDSSAKVSFNNEAVSKPQRASENEIVQSLVNNEKVTSIVCSFSQTARRTKSYLMRLGKLKLLSSQDYTLTTTAS